MAHTIRSARTLVLALACVGPLLAASLHGDELGEDFFESKIRPVLSEHCYKCHSQRAQSANRLRGGLRLDGRSTALKGGDSGPAIVPGKPDESLLIAALRYNDLEMPPSGRLSKQTVSDFARWIAAGAVWPDDSAPPSEPVAGEPDYEHWRQTHWAWRPIRRPAVPALPNESWPSGNIDRYVLARQRAAGLTPSPTATAAELVRRVYYDLTGLPPTFDQLQRALRDRRPGAYERLVERLLASPAYGEKWGRHWLDVARYADNGGFNSQTKELYTNFPYAFTYRDYVIRAFNEDLPFDRFITEQLAADRLVDGPDNRALAALGFLTLGDKSFGTSSGDHIDDCIDTVTRGIMGITVSCARCHDHKYDPIPTEDYYSLFSVFANSDIDVASRLHSVEKSEILPPIFASQAERSSFELRVRNLEQELEAAQQTFGAKASAHLRERLSDYFLAAANRATDQQKAGLSDELIKRWRTFLSAEGDDLFAVWRRFVALGDVPTAEFDRLLDEASGQGQDGASTINPLILQELRSRHPLDLDRVATAIATVLNRVLASDAPPQSEAERAIANLVTNDKCPLSLDRAKLLALPIHGGASELGRRRVALRAAKYDHPRAVALRDKKSLSEGRVLTRGNPKNPGDPVPRRFLALLSPERTAFSDGSGRLELARAIATADNPLTARVIVNRLWQHHFGVGLVRGASDFGVRSPPPSHPLLLDYLASNLIENGWSLKQIQREILLSQTYRQASAQRKEAATDDQDNQLLWRMNRRRLTFEGLRDSLLAASGELDRAMGGRPVPTWESRRRTVYGYVNRYRIAAGYFMFDFPSPLRTSAERSQTLVPQQSLFLMNAPFVQDRARALVARPEVHRLDNAAERVTAVYRRALTRDPSPAEITASLQFLPRQDDGDSEAIQAALVQLAHALFQTNEFMYVD